MWKPHEYEQQDNRQTAQANRGRQTDAGRTKTRPEPWLPHGGVCTIDRQQNDVVARVAFWVL